MKCWNIYLTGVGGQGIGLLSEVLSRGLLAAGYRPIGSDTHGLAQRGGAVVSHLRVADRPIGPIITPGQADLILALEQLEGLRAARTLLKYHGHLFYCDTAIQPIAVRMDEARYPTDSLLIEAVRAKAGTLIRVPVARLSNPRLQNTALLFALVTRNLIDGLTPQRVVDALGQVLPKAAFEANRELFLGLD